MMPILPIVTPIVHRNGDRQETLLDTLETAYHAVRAAMDALRTCAPNGRNYYPEPGRLVLAEAQHRARQEHLHVVLESLEAEAGGIQRESQR
jgi:hypothetical protein